MEPEPIRQLYARGRITNYPPTFPLQAGRSFTAQQEFTMTGGFDEVYRNLDALERKIHKQAAMAMDEITDFLENAAKTDHGDRPRAAGWVYPGGGVKRWREAGKGWGDVTGNLNQSIRGDLGEVSAELIKGYLTAGMDYAIFVELARAGRWAWLWPTIEKNQKQIMAILQRYLNL